MKKKSMAYKPKAATPRRKSTKKSTTTTKKTTTSRTRQTRNASMKNESMHTLKGTFYQLFLQEIQELYGAENQIMNRLPNLTKAAAHTDLRTNLQEHQKTTHAQVKRLLRIFQLLGRNARLMSSRGVEGILKEWDSTVNHLPKSIVKDAAIIGAAQKAEHYQIAAYGIARAHAKQLELDEVAQLLDESLEEEAAADKRLTKVAEGTFFRSGINQLALEEKPRALAMASR
jgi:ferritin-like metal-binding protein YciE